MNNSEKDVSEKRTLWSKISDNKKVTFFRWWFEGAVYFFIAWGTQLAMSTDPLDLLFVLAIVTTVVHIFIFNPICYAMFDIERKGYIINKKYYERKIWEGVLNYLGEFFRCLITVMLVFASYQGINKAIIAIFNYTKDVVVLKGEPIIYSTLFIIFYTLIGWICLQAASLVSKIKTSMKIKTGKKEKIGKKE